MNNDLISRKALKKDLHNFFDGKVIDDPTYILRDVFCYIDNAPTVEDLISATDFKKRINNMDYVYLQECATDVIDAIDCEITYFKEKMNHGKK